MTWTWGGVGSKNGKTSPATNSTTPSAPATGPRQRGNDTTRNTGRSGRQNALTRRSSQIEERVTVRGPSTNPNPTNFHARGQD